MRRDAFTLSALAALALAAPVARAGEAAAARDAGRDATGKAAPDFAVTSGDGVTLARAALAGRVAILFYETRETIDANRALKKRLAELVASSRIRPGEIAFVAVADATRANWLTRTTWRRGLRVASKREGVTVYGDWDGKMREAYGMARGESNVILVDRSGVMRFRARGTLEDEQLDSVIALVADILAPPPASPQPEGVAEAPADELDRLVREAIAGRRVIEFDYEGRPRVVEPHVYGIKGGRRGILAWQTGGESSSGRLPDWRRFHLDGVTQLRLLDRTFAGPREYPSGTHSSWDTTLAVVEALPPPAPDPAAPAGPATEEAAEAGGP